MRAGIAAAGRTRWGGASSGARLVIPLLAIVALAIGWVQKSPCLATYRDPQGAAQLDWRSGRPFADLCYSDVVALYGDERLDQPGMFPYKTSWIENQGTASQRVRYMEYPVLTGVFMWAGAKLAQGYASLVRSVGLPARPTVVVYFDLVALALAGLWLLTVDAVLKLTGRRPWGALLVALSPLVIVQGFTNFDALAVAFATAGMLAWSRRRVALAGVLLGLGGAAKLYPLLLLIPLVALCWRAGKLREGLRATAAAVAAWVVVNAPIALLFPAGWSEFFRFNTTRGAGFESGYTIASYFTGWGGFDGPLAPNQAPSILNAVSAALFGGLCLALVGITLSAPRRPRVAQLSLLVVAAFLLTNKVYSPQYSLWLVPLAVLALPRWRVLLAWMTIDALVWVPTMLFQLGPTGGGIGEGYLLATVLLRDLAISGLCALVLRDIYRPAHDLVRRDGQDDPCGGPLDGAEDRFVLGRRRQRAVEVA
ncbi:MAG: glycosyltransferase family 87 protein [Solirubrobacteraceae bacterium]